MLFYAISHLSVAWILPSDLLRFWRFLCQVPLFYGGPATFLAFFVPGPIVLVGTNVNFPLFCFRCLHWSGARESCQSECAYTRSQWQNRKGQEPLQKVLRTLCSQASDSAARRLYSYPLEFYLNPAKNCYICKAHETSNEV